MDLTEALVERPSSSSSPLVCVVGAGGKKTTLYALAERSRRALVTASVRIPIFDEHVARVAVTDDPLGAIADADGSWPLGLVPEREEGGERYLGYENALVGEIAAAAPGPVFVKADGARMREFKAPDDHEPQLPVATDVALPIASAHAVGKPLTDEHVHRPERVAAVTGLDPGDAIDAAAVGAVLASPRGGMKDVPQGARVVPVVNKVDDAELEATGREIAAAFYERVSDDAPVPYVALTHLRQGRLVATV
jgi:probable selenium-dependent hydroxylase accessory protein YqeC